MSADLIIRIRANAAEAQDAFRQVGAGLQQIEAQSQGVSRVFNANAGATANLAAQFNDIGMMLASGQSPMLLAIQQGSQISQVLGPMGARGAVQALGAGFMALLNPVSLATVGIIAGGAALFQWGRNALTAGEETETMEDRIKALTDALSGLDRANDRVRMSMADMTAEFGGNAEQAREFLEIQRQMAEAQAQRALNTATASAAGALGASIMELSPTDARLLTALERAVQAREQLQERALLGGISAADEATLSDLNDLIARNEQFLIGARQARDEIKTLRETFGLTAEEADRLVMAMAELSAAPGGKEQAEAAQELARYIYEATDGLKDADDAANLLYQQLLDVVVKGLEFAGLNISDGVREAAEQAERLNRALDEAGATARTHPRFGTVLSDRQGGSRGQMEDMRQVVDRGILDLIAYAEGTDRGRSYNETLGYGAFTGGPVNLTNMTLAEVRDLQRQMLAHPNNTFNSSAVGRYQIVGSTLEGLIGNLGLSMDERFTPELQDRLALELLRENGGGVGAVRGQWEGFGALDIPDSAIIQALGSTDIPSVDPERAAASAAAQEAAASAAQEADRAFQGLMGTLDRSEAIQQAYAQGQEVIDEALRAGVITAEEAAQATAMLDQRRDAGLAGLTEGIQRLEAATMRGADAVANLFLSFGDGADAAQRAVGQLLAEMARVQMVETFRGLAGGGVGTGFFGAIGGLLGVDGARADGGPVSAGRTYLVGERGPELFVPRISGAIVSNEAMNAAARGISPAEIIVRSEPGIIVETVRGEIAQAAPAIVRQSVQATGRVMRETSRFGKQR